MEESATAIDTKRLVIEAWQALRKAYVSEVGHGHSPVEQALIEAMNKLLRAIERSVQEAYAPLTFPLLDELPDDAPAASDEQPPLDELYASIMSRMEPTGNTSKRGFLISFPDVELSVDEVWPEGDAPEDPTPEDVIEVMRETEHAHPTTVATTWLLINSLSVRYNVGKDRPNQEIEWDGN